MQGSNPESGSRPDRVGSGPGREPGNLGLELPLQDKRAFSALASAVLQPGRASHPFRAFFSPLKSASRAQL